MNKYNIYIICKDEERFFEKQREFDKYKSKTDHGGYATSIESTIQAEGIYGILQR